MVVSKISPVVVIVLVAAIVTAFYVQARPHDDRLDGGRVSTQASTRLMKDLKDFYKSDSYKNGLFTVELVDDNIYEWHVKYFVNDPEIPVFEELQKVKEDGGEDHILLHIIYNANYPNEPPFVRVIYPYLIDNILFGGGVCHQLLSKASWHSEYTIESLMLQIAADVLNGSRIGVSDTSHSNYFMLDDARRQFKVAERLHQEEGDWPTPEPEQE